MINIQQNIKQKILKILKYNNVAKTGFIWFFIFCAFICIPTITKIIYQIIDKFPNIMEKKRKLFLFYFVVRFIYFLDDFIASR